MNRNLAESACGAQARIDALLLESGAVLSRGFDVTEPDSLAAVVRALGDATLGYAGGNSPRTKLSKEVYTSTEYPAELEITPHPELCYARTWPSRLFFACARAADGGGATPIVDLAEVLQRIDPAVLERFTARGLVYVRRMHGGAGLGRSWQTTFETTDRAMVERALSAEGARYEWGSCDELSISQEGPVTHMHPLTGQRVWFNQAEQWHPSGLPVHVRDALGPEPPPHDIRFGDGGIISDQDVAHVREVLWGAAAQFRWEPGDVLVVDNERVAHGRRSYRGPRRILVSMGVRRAAARAKAMLQAEA